MSLLLKSSAKIQFSNVTNIICVLCTYCKQKEHGGRAPFFVIFEDFKDENRHCDVILLLLFLHISLAAYATAVTYSLKQCYVTSCSG